MRSASKKKDKSNQYFIERYYTQVVFPDDLALSISLPKILHLFLPFLLGLHQFCLDYSYFWQFYSFGFLFSEMIKMSGLNYFYVWHLGKLEQPFQVIIYCLMTHYFTVLQQTQGNKRNNVSTTSPLNWNCQGENKITFQQAHGN